MEMMDDDSTDDDDSADANEIGAGRGGRVGGARTAAQEEGGSDDDDADGGGGKGEEESGLDLDGDSEDDEEEDGESGASGRSDGSGDEADQPEAAPPDWRAALADVAFEDIDKLRRDGARVQPLAKRSAQPGGEGPAKPQRANKNRCGRTRRTVRTRTAPRRGRAARSPLTMREPRSDLPCAWPRAGPAHQPERGHIQKARRPAAPRARLRRGQHEGGKRAPRRSAL